MDAIRAMAYEHMMNRRNEGKEGAGLDLSTKVPNGLLARSDVLKAVGEVEGEASVERERGAVG